MREVFARVARVASSSCTVLITGETGTGKELVAQAIHYSDADPAAARSSRSTARRCPSTLLESELFGHERGAFTGADRQKKGRFEQANGGTLFLDEIGELPLGMQAKLLRVLQDGTFERVGGTEVDPGRLPGRRRDQPRPGRGRRRRPVPRGPVLPAQRRLDRAAPAPRAARGHPAAGRPLPRASSRERRLPAKTISRETLSRLARYDWPGNVRELEHVIEQVVVTTPGPVIEPENLPAQIVSTREEPFSLDFDLRRPLQEITDELTERIERAYLHARPGDATAAGSTAAPRTAASRGGASARSSAATGSTRPTSSRALRGRKRFAMAGE